MARYISPVPQYLDAAGDPLALGKLFFFISGTNDPLETFADVNETIPNTQPVELLGDGRVPNIFYSGAAKVILTDSNDVQFWEKDPVTAVEVGSLGSEWDAITIFSIGAVVTFSGRRYESIINSNQNNNPATSPTAWTQFDLLKRWNINETYDTGDPVTATDGAMYTSLAGSNIGNDPINDAGFWTKGYSLRKWSVLATYDILDAVISSDGLLYTSLQASNLGNDPISSPLFWLNNTTKITTQVFTTSGTWTRPSGCKNIQAECQGAGGSGASPAIDGALGENGASGGGAGGYFRTLIDVTSIPSQSITVGIGGVASPAGGPTGTAGADGGFSTCFGLTSTGGAGGIAAGTNRGGGAGQGTSGGVDLSVRGGSGMGGSIVETHAGIGGSSYFGGNGGAPSGITAVGGAGVKGGGGGGGTGDVSTGGFGGDGGDGVVIITEYY